MAAKNKFKIVPGINIQWPWSEKIINGVKTIETRTYPIPKYLLNRYLALLETSGDLELYKRFQTRIIGLIKFSDSFRYSSKTQWKQDFKKHCVPNTSKYTYKDKNIKWGWTISDIICFDKPQKAPKTRGIKFTKKCRIMLSN